MAFAEIQTKLLAGKLPEKYVKTREQRGTIVSYVEGWHAIAEANRVFGFDGWDRETVWAECVWEDGRRDPKACAYAARVRIRVRAGETVVYRDGSGAGHGTGCTLGEAHESALKEAETDATKRALTTFGNLFGLALYDKEQSGVRRRTKGRGSEVSRAGSLELYSATGEVISRHESARAFCSALKAAMIKTTITADLESLWARNAASVVDLRTVWPDLVTTNGVHYADLLGDLYQRRLAQLQYPAAEAGTGSGAEYAAIDKSIFALAAPKRSRDGDHLRFVASLPCLVCGRNPSQAHHLRFAQPRSMGSKVSDEWTVPLCATHHHALHTVGNEALWWEERKIDAKAEAEKLWHQHHGPERHVMTPPPSEINGHTGDSSLDETAASRVASTSAQTIGDEPDAPLLGAGAVASANDLPS